MTKVASFNINFYLSLFRLFEKEIPNNGKNISSRSKGIASLLFPIGTWRKNRKVAHLMRCFWEDDRCEAFHLFRRRHGVPTPMNFERVLTDGGGVNEFISATSRGRSRN